jgi:low affinity Fe/Cu permease
MVFLIQNSRNSQNSDTAAIQITLDEIIRSLPNADDRLLDLEELGQQEISDKRAD